MKSCIILGHLYCHMCLITNVVQTNVFLCNEMKNKFSSTSVIQLSTFLNYLICIAMINC